MRARESQRFDRIGGDAGFCLLLFSMTLLVTWQRAHYDWWLSRHDIMTQYLQWYTYLGQRLRDFQIPAWNPYLNGGAPFAGDAQSGWMMLTAMATFPFLHASAAFKAMVGLELFIGGFSTYALARALKIGPAGAALAAVIFEFGPFLHYTTACCTVRANVAPWIPFSLLGIELAAASATHRGRMLPLFLAGFGMSQMYVGFFGQGAVDGLLVVAAYIAYRTLLASPRPMLAWRARVFEMVELGLGSLALSLALGAAGLFPRLDVIGDMEVSLGYNKVGGYTARPPGLNSFFASLIGDSPNARALAVGGVAFVLFFIGIARARGRFAVSFFAVMTVVTFTLSLGDTPLHRLFYLIPRFRDLHEHFPQQATAVVWVGPANIAGAAVESLRTVRRSRSTYASLCAPFIGLLALKIALRYAGLGTGKTSLLAGAAATVLILIIVTAERGDIWRGIARLAPAGLVLVAFILPTGAEMIGMANLLPIDGAWRDAYSSTAKIQKAVDIAVSSHVPGSASEFIQQQLAAGEHFRYIP